MKKKETRGRKSKLHKPINASFEEVKATVQALGRCLDDYKLKIEPVQDQRFIKGRCAKVTGKTFTGVFGEVDLVVLRKFNLEMPCTAFELELKRGDE